MASDPNSQGKAQSSSDPHSYEFRVASVDENDRAMTTSYIPRNQYQENAVYGGQQSNPFESPSDTAPPPAGYVPEHGFPGGMPVYAPGTLWPATNGQQLGGFTGYDRSDNFGYDDSTVHDGRQYSFGNYASENASEMAKTHNVRPPPGVVPSSSIVGSQGTEQPESVQCDHCKTILTGPYASGNLTRHQKSKKCRSSSRSQIFPCDKSNCDKFYHRSDALLNHKRKIHGAPGPLRKNSSMESHDVTYA